MGENKEMNKKIIIPLLVIFVVVIGVGSKVARSYDVEEVKGPESESSAVSTSSEPKETESFESKENQEPSDEIKNRDEETVMQAIHNMTHQKVEAHPKWGELQVTEERIDELLTALDEEDYKHEEFYSETLTAWKSGDFSNAVEVHNKLWKLQDGSIGEAIRLLTPEEEAEYVEKNF